MDLTRLRKIKFETKSKGVAFYILILLVKSASASFHLLQVLCWSSSAEIITYVA